MLRILVFLVFLLAIGFGFSWLADRPGELFIIWQGQRIEMSMMVAATLLAGLIFTIMLAWWLVRSIWTSPHSVRRYFRARNRDRGYQALSTGLIAAGAGDAAMARKMLGRTKSLLNSDQEPLIHILEAQAALIEGRHDEARIKFEQMAEDPETRELGLHGLYLEALSHGAHEAARHYAERAVEKAPHLPWAAEATLEYRTQSGQFDDAIRLLESQRALVGMDRKLADRKKAVLLTGRAMSKLENDPKGAREDALHALRLAADLVPAATIGAKALFREDNPRKALSTLEHSFKLDAHPEIAAAYVRGPGGDASAERLKRARKLESLQPESYEALYSMAAAALDAREFGLAREKAEAAARIEERESIYLLMADLEEAETGDQGRARHWLSQALRAPRDPAWIADGQISAHWLPVSPVTGRLDAFEWKVPYGPAAGMIDNDAGANAEQAFAGLPALGKPKSEERTIVLEPKPANSGAPASVTPDEAAPRKEKPAPGAEPFFGRPPDDPGVKKEVAPSEAGFKLF